MGIMFIVVLCWVLLGGACCVDGPCEKTEEAPGVPHITDGMDSLQASYARLLKSAPSKRRLSGANKEEDYSVFVDTPHTATRRNRSYDISHKKRRLFATSEEPDVDFVPLDTPHTATRRNRSGSSSSTDSKDSQMFKIDESCPSSEPHKIVAVPPIITSHIPVRTWSRNGAGCAHGRLLGLTKQTLRGQKTVNLCIRRQRYGQEGMDLVWDKATDLNRSFVTHVANNPLRRNEKVEAEAKRGAFADLEEEFGSDLFVFANNHSKSLGVIVSDRLPPDYFPMDAFEAEALREITKFAVAQLLLNYNIITGLQNDFPYGMQVRPGSSYYRRGTEVGTPVDSVVSTSAGGLILYFKSLSTTLTRRTRDRVLPINIGRYGFARSVQLMALAVVIVTRVIRVEYDFSEDPTETVYAWTGRPESWDQLLTSCRMKYASKTVASIKVENISTTVKNEEIKVRDIFEMVREEVNKLSKLELGDLADLANCGGKWRFTRWGENDY